MTSTKWNVAFTNLIRNNDRAGWGNWTLDPAIRPGAVGYIDPETAHFTLVSHTIPGGVVKSITAAQAWTVESSHVKRTETSIDFKGGYKDPTSSKTVDVGVEAKWTFDSEKAVSSNAGVASHEYLDDFGTVLTKNFDWLKQQAASVGMATGDGIAQGFGVVTHAVICTGAVNLASLDEKSSFSITGSVDGVAQMTGGGSVSASLKGSYKDQTEDGAFEKYLWPATTDEAAPADVAISYDFASFNDTLIMPSWAEPISDFGFVFDNGHGGTYICDCEVAWDEPGKKDRQSKSTTAPGGQTRRIDNVPLSATNIKIRIHFVAGDTYNHSFQVPLTKILSGQRTFDCYGVWPWSSYVKIREHNDLLG